MKEVTLYPIQREIRFDKALFVQLEKEAVAFSIFSNAFFLQQFPLIDAQPELPQPFWRDLPHFDFRSQRLQFAGGKVMDQMMQNFFNAGKEGCF